MNARRFDSLEQYLAEHSLGDDLDDYGHLRGNDLDYKTPPPVAPAWMKGKPRETIRIRLHGGLPQHQGVGNLVAFGWDPMLSEDQDYVWLYRTNVTVEEAYRCVTEGIRRAALEGRPFVHTDMSVGEGPIESP